MEALQGNSERWSENSMGTGFTWRGNSSCDSNWCHWGEMSSWEHPELQDRSG